MEQVPTNLKNKELCINGIISNYKSLIKVNERSWLFITILWNNNLNKLMKHNFYFKLKNSLRGWKKFKNA